MNPIPQRITATDNVQAESIARDLIGLGFHQVSRRYRTLARVPEGKNARDALYEAEMAQINEDRLPADTYAFWVEEKRRWVEAMGEGGSASFFRRVHARGAGLWVELDQLTFDAFKRLGGHTS